MKRIMINADNCKGCKNCSIACMQAHRESDSGSFYDLDLTDPANESRNMILLNAQNKYIPLFCRHCDQPKCVSSCMSGALVKDLETGLVRYDKEKCGSCFMCVMNCPYGVLKPDKATQTEVIRCDFCAKNGEDPSCVKVCRSEAIYVREV